MSGVYSFWIGAALVAAGTAANSYATRREQTRAAHAADQAAYEQGQYQTEIANKIKNAASTYDADALKAKSDEEAAQMTQSIKDNVSESQQLRDESQQTAGNVSSDYDQARQASMDKTQEDLNAFSELMGRLRGTNTARLKNQFGLMDYGQQVSQLARNAQGAYNVAQERIQNAANSKQGLHNIGTIGSTIGSLMMMGGGLAAGGASNAANAAGQASTLAETQGAAAASNLAAAGSADSANVLGGLAQSGSLAGTNAWAAPTLGNKALVAFGSGLNGVRNIFNTGK